MDPSFHRRPDKSEEPEVGSDDIEYRVGKSKSSVEKQKEDVDEVRGVDEDVENQDDEEP